MTIESDLRACPPETLVDARNMTHKAVQSVARAARANIPAAPDESHTSLVWDEARGALRSNPIAVADGTITVALALSSLTLMVTHNERTVAELPLSGVAAGDDDDWLDAQLSSLGLKPAKAVPHPYDLPPAAAEIATYATAGMETELAAVAAWFAFSDAILQRFVAGHGDIRPGPSPVRCWAHHFDIATYVSLEAGDSESARAIGVGLSPGDTSYEQPYFYVNPWPRPDTGKLPRLPGLGHWHTEGFVGAVLTGIELVAVPDIAAGAEDFVAAAFAIGRSELGT